MARLFDKIRSTLDMRRSDGVKYTKGKLKGVQTWLQASQIHVGS